MNATATQTKTPEKFAVGETVSLYWGEYVSSVVVFAVDGDTVTAGTHREIADVYVPRSDGQHVKVGTSDHAHMPTKIFHTTRTSPAHRKVTRWDRMAQFFSSL